MRVEPTEIAGVLVLTPTQHRDVRGSFAELYNRQRAVEAGIPDEFVQDNLVVSRWRGTLRGLHFQRPPAAQSKLVRVLAGAVVDFVVDLRRGGPSFGRAVSLRLDAEEGRMLYVPVGCAHGYCTLKDQTVVLYKVGDYYAPDCEMGLAADDPALGLALPFPADRLMINQRDRRLPRLAELPEVFRWTEPGA